MMVENYACEDVLGKSLGWKENSKKYVPTMFERANSQRKMKSEN